MEVTAIVAPIFILLTLLIAALPILIGIFIYKDAKKRGMNAALWTLIGILAPGFIGLIIYLIVRGEHPDLQCFSCGKPVSEAFAVCPYCGTTLKEKCANCGYSLETGWENCPSCGSDIPEEQRRTTVRKKSSGLKWLLAIVIAVPLALMVLLFAATCLFVYEVDQGGCRFEPYILEKSAIYEDQKEILDWISGCDAQGDGTYVLRTDFNMGATAMSNILVYRNDGYYDLSSTSTGAGGLFVAPELEISYYSPGSDSKQDYTLTAYEFAVNNENRMYLELFDTNYDGYSTEIDYVLTESDALDGLITNYFSEDYVMEKLEYTIGIDEKLTGVYAVSSDIWVNGEVIESQSVMNAEMSDMNGENFFFEHYIKPGVEDYSIVVTLFDENNDEIFSTEKIDMRENVEWDSLIHFFINGDKIGYKF